MKNRLQIAKRVSHVQQLLATNHLDAIFISSVALITYLTDYAGFSPTEHEAFLFVTKTTCFAFTNSLYITEFSKRVPHFKIHEITSDNPLTTYLKQIKETLSVSSIGYEEEGLTVSEFNKLQKVFPKKALKPVDLNNLRMHKDDTEIASIQRACQIGEEAFQSMLSQITLEQTEKEIAFLLEIFIRKQTAELSFPTIIASGKNAANIHHLTSDQKITNNSFLLFDFGVRINNYCSDIARTIFIGTPTDHQKKLYQTVQTAQSNAVSFIEKKLKNGEQIITSAVDTFTRDCISAKGFPPFPHALGHGIGIAVHEMPILSPRLPSPLSNNQVFTLEPGIYLPHIAGVRIEDVFVIEDNQLKYLTHPPQKLIIL